MVKIPVITSGVKQGDYINTTGYIPAYTTTDGVQITRVRSKMDVDKTVHVSTSGSDTTGDGSVGKPWASLPHALDYALANLDLGGRVYTIQLANGTYNTNWAFPGCMVYQQFPIPNGLLRIRGDPTTPSNVTLDPNAAGGHCFVLDASAGMDIQLNGLKLKNSGGGGSLIANLSPNSVVDITNCDLGACAGGLQIQGAWNSVTRVFDALTVSGGATACVFTETGAQVEFVTGTVTLTGTPNFTGAFVSVATGAVFGSTLSYSGSATGRRWAAYNGGVIRTTPGTLTDLPGNADGIAYQGGVYNEWMGPCNPTTVASLPSANRFNGMMATVTDATAPAVGSAVAGGGAAFAAVMWNGAQWTVFSK